MPSALKQQTIVAAYIDNEITLGRLIGPLPTNVAQFVHRNRIGVVPKGHTPASGAYLPTPGYSVNNGIDPVLCSLSYVSIDTVAAIVASLGAGSLLAKIDIESAYRMVPVHPDDCPLLGFEWSGRIYCDAMLPFGLMQVISQDLHGSRRRIRMDCSPKRGTAHRALPGRLRNGGRTSLLSMRRQPANNESRLQGTGRSPGGREMRRPDVVPHFPRHRTRHRSLVPAPSRRQDHPHQGYLLDWNDRKACRRRVLESLIGLLQHACKVVKPGRSFLRRMICCQAHSPRPQQIFPRGSLLVEHLHIRLEWHRLHAQSCRRASSFLLRCSRIMGLRGVLESPLAADSMHGMHDRSLSPFP